MQIKRNGVRAAEIQRNAVGASEIRSNAVAAGDVADGAIGIADLGDNSVGSGEVVNGSLVEADLQAGLLDVKPNITVQTEEATVDLADGTSDSYGFTLLIKETSAIPTRAVTGDTDHAPSQANSIKFTVGD